MVLPERHHAAQEIGAAQQRAVGGSGAAEGDVVAAAGAGVGAVEGELLGAEPGEPGFLVERFDDGAQRPPGRTRLDVDLDDAGVRGDDQGGQPRVARQRVALDDDRALEFVGHRLDDGQQLDDILGTFERREEHPDVAVARLHRDRCRRSIRAARRWPPVPPVGSQRVEGRHAARTASARTRRATATT